MAAKKAAQKPFLEQERAKFIIAQFQQKKEQEQKQTELDPENENFILDEMQR